MTPMPNPAASIDLRVSMPVGDDELNDLFSASWPGHRRVEFQPVLQKSLAHVCAYLAGQLVGFVNLAWDGRAHAFLLDTTVHPAQRRRGLGLALVACALAQARQRGVTWVHVDHEPSLRAFYARCGFRPTEAGLWHAGPERKP